MADIADKASEVIEGAKDDAVRLACRNAAAMPKGEPGECALCGNESMRLVRGACAPCRDLMGLE